MLSENKLPRRLLFPTLQFFFCVLRAHFGIFSCPGSLMTYSYLVWYPTAVTLPALHQRTWKGRVPCPVHHHTAWEHGSGLRVLEQGQAFWNGDSQDRVGSREYRGGKLRSSQAGSWTLPLINTTDVRWPSELLLNSKHLEKGSVFNI